MSFARVAVVEPLCWGLEHAPINAALIAAVLQGFPQATVDVYGEASHLAAVEELLRHTRNSRLARVTWRSVRVPPRKIRGWQRVLETRRLLRELDAAFHGSSPDALVISTVDSPLLALLKARLLGAWRRRPAIAVFHELLAALERRGSPRRRGLVAALAVPHPAALKYLVLAEAIRTRLLVIAPRLAAHVVSVDHPSLLGDIPATEPLHVPPPLRFGFVGGGRSAKRLADFAHLARDVRSRYANMEFHVVGAVPDEFPRRDLAGLSWSDARLPLLEYVGRIRQLSHVVWLGDPEHYRLVASGSLVDAIALGVPILCQSGPLSAHLFRGFGDIGWLCDSVAEMRETIGRLASSLPVERDRAQRERLREARQQLAPEACAGDLRGALSDPD